MRSRCPRSRKSLRRFFTAALLLTAALRPATAGTGIAVEGVPRLIFADGFESGDTALWLLDYLLWLPFGAIDLALPVQFAPVDPRADLVLSLDTTGSMGGEITNLQNGLSTISTSVLAMVPDTAFAVGDWHDFPISPFGDPPGSPGNMLGDKPWQLLQPVTTNVSLIQVALNGMTALGGNDIPESGYEALYQVGAGTGVSWPGGSIPAYPGPGLGGVGFRAGTLPLVVHVTDAPSHTDAEYAAAIPDAHSKSAALAALTVLGARVIPVLSFADATANAQLLEAATATGAEVLPCGFTHVAGCPANLCCTGINGAGEAPNGSGRCPLRFRISTEGTGASTAVVLGMEAAVKYGTHEVLAGATDDGLPGTLDTACFIDRIEADVFIRPPQEPEASCVSEATPVAIGGFGYNDGFTNLATGSVSGIAGSELRFVVHASNLCAPSTASPQLYVVNLNLTDTVTGELMDHLALTVAIPASP